jgi:LytS/YehU family sensor histidine kinase
MEELNFRYSQDTALLKKNILIRQKEQKLDELSNSLVIIVLLFVIAVLVVYFVIINLKKKHELNYSRQVAIITKLRMENVRNQISPHFIFNVLNSMVPDLKEHSVLNKSVESLIQSIRGNLVASEKIALPIEEEVKNVKSYLGLLENLQSKLPKVQWEIADDVDLDIPILSMCIQIPVENAVKYAFADRTENDLLEIKILKEERNIKIEVTDNGVGFDPSKHIGGSRGTGTGLKILYKTIDLLNRKNSDKVEFDIQNNRAMDVDSSGTKVTIKIPLGFNFHYE